MTTAGPSSQRDMLTVVSPCYNEERVIELFYEQLRAELVLLDDVDYRIVFVDDGSSDGTLDRLNAIAARDERVGVYSFSRNFGHQAALSAGLQAADGDAVVMMDCDLQHPPALIAEFVRHWRAGSEVVSAVRQRAEDASWFKQVSARSFYWLINRLSETKVVEGAADFCLLSRTAHDALVSMPERHRFLRGMVSWIGFRRSFVPFTAPPRAAGESKYTLLKMVSLALDAVFSFSAAPMRMATRLGASIALLGAVYLAYILLRYVALGDLVPGWGSLICTMLLIGGAQLTFIGIVGEYVARIFEEVKGRPLYVLKQSPGEAEGADATKRRAGAQSNGRPAITWDVVESPAVNSEL